MATYVIGDVQGCHDTLQLLLERCGFGPRDRVRFIGDLVNRGPKSADVLRLALRLGERCDAVLGNHDLHLLARAEGVATTRRRDTLDDVLEAPDRDELLGWLRARPFVLDEDPWLLLHAGVLPGWNLDELLGRATRAATVLRSADGREMLRQLATREPVDLRPGSDPVREAVATARILTNLRCCGADGSPRLEYAGPPEEAGDGLRPWYESPGRKDLGRIVVCGHWAAQGLRRTRDMVALDSGCVWGHQLSAFRLDDESLVSVPCPAPR